MPDRDVLDQEIDVFCRYLLRKDPDQYVRTCYRKAHDLNVVGSANDSSRFERLIVRIARTAPWWTRLADAHTRVFGGDLLRKKMVLALGILENSPQFHLAVDSLIYPSRLRFLVAACGAAAFFAMAVVAGMLFFLPLRLACALLGEDRRN